MIVVIYYYILQSYNFICIKKAAISSVIFLQKTRHLKWRHPDHYLDKLIG